MDINLILNNLKLRRPVFCSEADFQHSFAWEAHLRYPEAKVYLEYNNPIIPQKMYTDLWFSMGNINYAIELKYKTRKLDLVKEYGFMLGEQSSQDTSRYDYLLDIERLERVVEMVPDTIGFAIMLTNDHNFWTPNITLDVNDAEFRIHENTIISGKRSWNIKAGDGTIEGRRAPIDLRGKYAMKWSNFHSIPLRNGEFKYIINKIRLKNG